MKRTGKAKGARTGTYVTAPLPEGVAPGNLLVLKLTVSGLVGSDPTVPAPWTKAAARAEHAAGGFQTTIWTARYTEGMEAPKITWDGEEREGRTFIVSIAGADEIAPVVEAKLQVNEAESAKCPTPKVTAAEDNSFVLAFADSLSAIEETGPPAGMEYTYGGPDVCAAQKAAAKAAEATECTFDLKAEAFTVGAAIVLKPEAAPVNTEAPSISGAAGVGSTLTCDPGTWTNALSYAYQWQLSAAGSGWLNIVGETAATYTVLDRDRRHQVRCVVTASNEGASVEATAPGLDATQEASGKDRLKVVAGLVVPEPAVLVEAKSLSDYVIQAAPDELGEHGPRVYTTADPLGSGQTVIALRVWDEDVAPFTPTESPRAQIALAHCIPDSGELWWRIRYMLPGSFPAALPAGGWLLLAQLFCEPFEGSPPISLTLGYDEESGKTFMRWQRNETYAYDIPWSTTWERDHWYEALLRVGWAKEGSVEMWLDGQQVTFFDPEMPGAHNPGEEPPSTKLAMETRDASSNEGAANVYLNHYRHKGMAEADPTWEGAIVYHKPMLLKAAA